MVLMGKWCYFYIVVIERGQLRCCEEKRHLSQFGARAIFMNVDTFEWFEGDEI